MKLTSVLVFCIFLLSAGCKKTKTNDNNGGEQPPVSDTTINETDPPDTSTPTGGGMVVPDDSYYTIISRYSGRLMGISGSSKNDGADAVQTDWPKKVTASQVWRIIPAGDKGYYYIINMNSKKYLGVGGSTTEGASIQQEDSSGKTGQQWQIIDVGNEYHKIVNRKSGLAVEVAYGSNKEGATIDQRNYGDNESQQWQILPPNILAVGDMEDQGNQYNGFHGPSQFRQLEFVTNPVRQGTYAAKFTIAPGDKFGKTAGERGELSGFIMQYKNEVIGGEKVDVIRNRAREGDDLYFAWSSYFPEGFPEVYKFLSFMNWHASSGGSVGVLSMRVNDGQNPHIELQRAAGNCPDNTNCISQQHVNQITPDLKYNEWYDFVIHAKFTCGNDGILELWYKTENETAYKKMVDLQNIPTLQFFKDYCNPTYMKIGIYRSSGNGDEGRTHVIYQDGFVEGLTFDAVTKWAHQNGSMPEF